MAVRFGAVCPSHPDPATPAEVESDRLAKRTPHGRHECMAGEMRCAYCGLRLHPHPCNGCGKFLTAREMHENESRCDDCM